MNQRWAFSLPAVASIMALLLIVASIVAKLIQRVEPPQHIVLVVLDTVRADHLSTYGYERDTTPQLARFAEQSLVFEQARATAPWTLPSHASLFTGEIPSSHGCHWEHRFLVPSKRTVAEDLRDLGYETFGLSSNVNVSRMFHLDQGFDEFIEIWKHRDQNPDLDDSVLVNGEIGSWLQRRDKKQPFFLFVNYMDAHLPYRPSPPYDQMFGDVSDEARAAANREDLLAAVLSRDVVLTDSVRNGLVNLYDGELRQLDQRVGELLGHLDEAGVAEHTLVIITSDHGEMLGEHGLVDHQLAVFEEVLRVPLLVRFPGRVNPGRVRQSVSLQQVADWIRDASVGQTPEWTLPPERTPIAWSAEYFQPHDLLDELRAKGLDTQAYEHRWWAAVDADTRGRFKLVSNNHGVASLFDLKGTGEGVDASEEFPQMAARLRNEVDLLRRAKSVEMPEDLSYAGPVFGGRAEEELRRLGYIVSSGAIGMHAAEHWAAGMRAREADEFDRALAALNEAVLMAPAHLRLRWDLAETADLAHSPQAEEYYREYVRQADEAGVPSDSQWRERAEERLKQFGGSKTPTGE